MFVKVTICLTLLAVAFAVPIEYQGYELQEEKDYPAEYSYGYSIHDEHTGDIKSHQESRKGYEVQGQYDLVEPDGHKRTVQYTANKDGFNAVVHREETNYKIPQPAQYHKNVDTSSGLGQYSQLAHYPQNHQISSNQGNHVSFQSSDAHFQY